MSAHGTLPLLHSAMKCIDHHFHMRMMYWKHSDAGCGVTDCSLSGGAAAGGSRGSIFPEWQHTGVEHTTQAACCQVGTPGAVRRDECSTLGELASLTGGRRASKRVGGGGGDAPAGGGDTSGGERRRQHGAAGPSGRWINGIATLSGCAVVANGKNDHLQARRTHAEEGWQMRGALPSGYPAHMRRRKACRIAPCARTVPEDRCSQSHTNTGLLRLLGLCVTHPR